jgi:hypothetical protein
MTIRIRETIIRECCDPTTDFTSDRCGDIAICKHCADTWVWEYSPGELEYKWVRLNQSRTVEIIRTPFRINLDIAKEDNKEDNSE